MTEDDVPRAKSQSIASSVDKDEPPAEPTMTEIHCGCGDYSIEVSDHKPIYQFGAVCPECNNHFGFDASNEVEENCPTCGAGPSFQSLLWTEPDGAARGESPDWIGCDECLTLRPVDEDVKEITFDK